MTNEYVLLALRELLARCPETVNRSPESLAYLLWEDRYLSRHPEACEIEAALEVLRVEGELLA